MGTTKYVLITKHRWPFSFKHCRLSAKIVTKCYHRACFYSVPFFITRGAGFNLLEIIFDWKIRFWRVYFVNQNLVHITRFFIFRVLYSSSYVCVEFPSLY